MPIERKRLRCAIYTRKSSEEGLEQAFNSLAAQREACVAFIHSQRHEGWRVLETHYDDGGYSGATLQRPALQRLLADLAAGKLDCVVVYKVDRLTRALVDFAKLVQAFDAHGIGFVSVTQQFNTTSSMGRLTLNVLLSFAQFEREVTAERIRDKFAASKRKGLWTGGRVPLGYDLKERQLCVNVGEAALVRSLCKRYLELGCVSKLSAELVAHGVLSKRRVSRRGAASGGVIYSRGALYALLKNRLYRGEIVYRGQSYPGNHLAIIELELWERVQQQLAGRRKARREGARARIPSLLLGLVHDEDGMRYTPSHTVHNGKCYRYYVAHRVAPTQQAYPVRIPAQELEALVLQRLLQLLNDQCALLDALSDTPDDASVLQELLSAARARYQAWSKLAPEQQRGFVRTGIALIIVRPDSIVIALNKYALRSVLLALAAQGGCAALHNADEELVTLSVEARLQRRGRAVRLVVTPHETNVAARPEDRNLIEALAQAYCWLEQLLRGEVGSLSAIAKSAGKSQRYVSQVMRAAFLAPELVQAVLDAHQPTQLTLRPVMKPLSWDWSEQHRYFGLAPNTTP